MRCSPYVQVARLTSLLATLQLFAVPTQAWVLDKSCNPYKDVVETAVGHAFDLTATSLYTLHNKKSGDPDLVVARQTLISYLFSWLSSDSETAAKVPGTFQTVMSFGDPNKKLTDKYDFNNPPKTVPAGWGQVEAAPADYTTLSHTNFIVYCDDSRIIRDKDNDGNDITLPGGTRQYYDKTLDIVDTIDEGWEQCWNGNLIGGGSTSAFALGAPDRPGSLQLCPWYIKKFQTASKSVWDRGVFGNLAKMIDDADDRKRLHQTKMDNIAGLASTVLHELTHLAGTVDLPDVECYAWQPCVAIGKGKNAWQNADSYAMFALGADLIEGTPAQAPTEDGDVGEIRPDSNKNNGKRGEATFWKAIDVNRPVPTTMRKVPSDSGKPAHGASSSSSAAPRKTTTVVPFTSDGHTTSIVYTSQDVKGPDGKSVPRWACVGDLCDPKCKVPSVCKVGDGDYPGGLGWHVRPGWAPLFTGSTSSGPAPTGGPQPQPTPAPAAAPQSRSSKSTGSATSSSSSRKHPSSRSSSSSAVTTTSKPAAGAVFTTIPFTNPGGQSTSIIYQSQDVKGSDGKSKPEWKCLGPLCDPKCLIPSLCKDNEGDFPGGLGWHVCCDWSPHIGGGGSGGGPPTGGPSPPPPEGKPDDPDNKSKGDDNMSKDDDKKSTDKKTTDKKTTSKASSTSHCSVTATSTCFQTEVVSRVTVKGRSTWSWTTSTKNTCKPTVACSVTHKDETVISTVSPSSVKYVTATHWIDTPPNINVEGQQSMLDKIAANSNGKIVFWTPPGSGSSTSKTSTTSKHSSTSKSSKPTPSIFKCTEETKNQCSPAVVCSAPQFIACVDGKCVCSETPPKPASSSASHSHALPPPPPPSTTQAPTKTTPAYEPGTCTLSMTEVGAANGVMATIAVQDNGGATIATYNSKDVTDWQQSINIPADKLKNDINIDFLGTQLKKRSSDTKRMVGGGTPGEETPPWMAYGIKFSVGDTKWTSADTSGLPSCSIGKWNGEFDMYHLFHGVSGTGWPRDVTCKWKC